METQNCQVIDSMPNLAEVQISYSTKIKPADRQKVTCSSELYKILKTLYDPNRVEHVEEFFMICLNRANHVMAWHKLSTGGISGVVVDVRVVAQIAINTNSSGVVISHNHPSGEVKPSEQDRAITKKIKEALKLFEITLLDHIIYTPYSYKSFADDFEL